VYLNIYDISPLNHYLYWFGLGIFHSGIEGNSLSLFHRSANYRVAVLYYSVLTQATYERIYIA